MIGPSSSHTAGAVRIGLVARALADNKPAEADIFFHGSFAETGKGHATDRGIVAGLLGFATDDVRLKDSLELAAGAGLKLNFSVIDLGEQAHPNTARIIVRSADGLETGMTAASIGGGMIKVVSINKYATDFAGDLDALVIWNQDKPGFLSRVTTVLACVDANIATIRTARKTRNTEALTIIELDAPVPEDALSVIRKTGSVNRALPIPRVA